MILLDLLNIKRWEFVTFFQGFLACSFGRFFDNVGEVDLDWLGRGECYADVAFGVDVETGREREVLLAVSLNLEVAGISILQVLDVVWVRSYFLCQVHVILVITFEKS